MTDSSRPPIKAALFDLDGTLVETLQDIANSLNRVLERRGLPTHPLEAFKQFVGDGMPTLCRRAMGEAAADEKLSEQVTDEMRVEYTEHQFDDAAPYDGIVELLDDLESRDVLLAVLTNKPHDNAITMVEQIFGKERFEIIHGHVWGEPPKPDPMGALRVLSHLKVPARSAVMLGDSGLDMVTACNTGMVGVGCLWGFRDAQELRAGGADFLAAQARDVLGLLPGLA